MKWSLQQLLKIQKFPYSFEETLDLSAEIEEIEDIYEIGPVNITGSINRLDHETYQFVYRIQVKLVLQCALTLDPVEYVFDEEYDEIYSTTENDEYILIEKNTIDTYQMAWSNIIIDKPINVTRPDAYEVLKQRGISLEEEFEEDDDDYVISYSDGRQQEEEN
ncbi:MAG: hypothetical protein IKT40_06820 [Bacilli bacterium]|jgi:uncharacterized metal-binding protein YceD (DUF177 family)|nr:hypothetical protein [Bacilli bacterium]